MGALAALGGAIGGGSALSTIGTIVGLASSLSGLLGGDDDDTPALPPPPEPLVAKPDTLDAPEKTQAAEAQKNRDLRRRRAASTKAGLQSSQTTKKASLFGE